MEGPKHKTKQICKNPNPLKDKKLKKDQTQKQEEQKKQGEQKKVPQIKAQLKPKRKSDEICQYHTFFEIFEQGIKQLRHKRQKLLRRYPQQDQSQQKVSQKKQNNIQQKDEERPQQNDQKLSQKEYKLEIPANNLQRTSNQLSNNTKILEKKQQDQENLFQNNQSMKDQSEQKKQKIERELEIQEKDEQISQDQNSNSSQYSQTSSIFDQDQIKLQNKFYTLTTQQENKFQEGIQQRVLRIIQKCRKTFNQLSPYICVQCNLAIKQFMTRIYRKMIYYAGDMRMNYIDNSINYKIKRYMTRAIRYTEYQLDLLRQFLDQIEHQQFVPYFRIQSPGQLVFPSQTYVPNPHIPENQAFDYMYFQKWCKEENSEEEFMFYKINENEFQGRIDKKAVIHKILGSIFSLN